MALPSRDHDDRRYQAGDVIAGKYRLEQLLGQGGMGVVWGAFNLQLEAAVAIKLLMRSERDDRDVMTQRLKQEAKATAKLGHPAIVRVFDVGESELGDAFIVMELLSGRSLAAMISEEAFLSGVHAVKLLLPIADALAVAHSKSIIHRDLKPDNVFIASEEGAVQPKLVDFGIAKIAGVGGAGSALTQAGTLLGSPDYMSPEQARGSDDLDHRTDIWSFCVVLYEALTGTTPFAAANYNALLRAILEEPPREHVVQGPEEEALWAIVLRGLEKDRELRFRSMSELGRALASWLIRQGVTEDIAGSSLEAKWILRPSDPTTLRASRASLPSFSGLTPRSGIRPTTAAGTAPTVDFGAGSANGRIPAGPAAETIPAPATPPQPALPPKSRAPLAAVAASAALVTLGLVAFVWPRPTAPITASTPRASGTHEVVVSMGAAAALPMNSPPTVTPEPPLGGNDPSRSASVRPAPTQGTPSAGARALTRAPTPVPKPVRATKTPAKSPEQPSPPSDLISPY